MCSPVRNSLEVYRQCEEEYYRIAGWCDHGQVSILKKDGSWSHIQNGQYPPHNQSFRTHSGAASRIIELNHTLPKRLHT
jgi:hypothetical protein